ncbi:MAG: beta-N-acetylhexosaminidase [Bacteroidales bacterium]|nr:beta-N-acetylhexosaminidase [Bacteroidales bacterium]
MTMDALKDLANRLSKIGINTIIMEWEATFPYEKHATLSNRYAYTRSEVISFIEYCSRLGIDVIPLQNCFGHVEYILRHDRYAALREDSKDMSQVCPTRENLNKEIFKELFEEMAKLHPSKYLHIGGDETRLLGVCKKCSAKVETEGKSKLFVDYVKIMCDIAKSLGKTPILWADIILKYPEAAEQLPKDAIFVDWNYGWKNDRFGDTENLLKHGFEFWGAPALRSGPDNLYITQWNKHFDNISTFIPACREAGYKGIVMTSWSTSGQYGYKYDIGWEVITMYPIRYVYPLSGFNILIAAYGQALNNHVPLDSYQFIVDYAQNQFGLTADESRVFYNILFAPQNTVRYGRDSDKKSILDLKNEAFELQNIIQALRPKSNKKEFEHFRLMFDLRLQYLTFKEIETRYQSADFDSKNAKGLLKELDELHALVKKNDKQFIKLNSNYLSKKELIELNQERNEKFYNLLDAVRKISD